MKIVLFTMRWSLLGLSLAVLVLWARGSLPAFNLLHQAVPGYAAAVMLAAPAVVNIEALSSMRDSENPLTNDPVFRDFFGQTSAADNEHRASSLGSGVILDRSGVVLTNYHVIRGSEAIRVSLADGRSSPGRVIGTDPDSDLAVLKINLENLPSVVVGQSDDLRVGDVVLAVGNALGIGQTVTQGIVSATGRNRVGINTFENFIQTDAAINFGNSGGALIDTRGRLVGINSVRLDSEGIGFAIPTGIAVPIARQILRSGSVERGWLGIDARDLSDSLRRLLKTERGIAVLATSDDGPADRAGVKLGDVLTALDNDPITDSRGAIELIAGLKPGARVAFHGIRNGKAYTAPITVSRRPPVKD